MTRTLSTACILLLVFALSGPSSSAGGGGGTAVYDFLRVPMNARAASLGNTFLTMRNDPAILFTNPGGLSTIEKPAGSIGFVKYLLDINAGYATYTQSYEDLGHFAAGIVYMNYGSFEETDKLGTVLGEFSASDIALSLGYGRAFDNVHVGAAVKIIYSSYAEFSSSGLALDAGVDYVIPGQELVIGFSVLNLGAQLSSYGTTSEALPLDVKVGIGKKLEHLPLTIMLNFHKLNEQRDGVFDHLSDFSIGGEFVLSKALRARVGYNNEMRRELKVGETAKLAGFSAGVGITVSQYFFDYGYTSFGQIGSLHRVSLSAAF
ncbi:MAG: type IX secretion system protein PorQ [Ignavibacteriae bacterium]|nr:type IX secretion system protein PorQ [Ignavibacteriota bacterium]